MRFYAAGRFRRYADVRAIIDLLNHDGHQCTYDWTRTDEFDEHGDALSNLTDGGDSLPYARQRFYASKDIAGVAESDYVIVLADDTLLGAWIELGAAIAWEKHIIVIAPKRHSIFFAMPTVRVVESISEMVDLIPPIVAA